MTNAEINAAANVAEQGAHAKMPKTSGKKGAARKQSATTGQKTAKKAKSASKPTRTKESSEPRAESKGAKLLALLRRPKGATLTELAQVTSWQNHSIRGFVSGVLGKKMGLSVESTKREDGERVYSLKK